MDAHVIREPVDRELRRRQLAQRLVAHEARTQTVFQLTGLSRHQQATLRQRWRVPQVIRHRGPPPTSFATFRANALIREEAAALAVLCKCAGIALASSRSQPMAAALDVGEFLCDAFEMYVACLVQSEFEFEHVALLARGLEEGGTIAPSNCGNCGAVILLDLLETRRLRCLHCQQWAERGDVTSEFLPEGGAGQQELF